MLKIKDKSGKTWTTRKFAKYAKRSMAWAALQMNRVFDGELTMNELLRKNKNNRYNWDKVEVVGKLINPETGKRERYTIERIIRKAGVMRSTACTRLKKFMKNELDEDKLFIKRLSGTGLYDRKKREEACREMELVAKNKLSFNKWLYG